MTPPATNSTTRHSFRDFLRSPARDAAIALVYTGIILTTLEYVFLPTRIEARARNVHWSEFPPLSLESGVTWALATIAGFSILPLVLICLVHRQSPADFGYQWRGLARHLWIYGALFLLMLPLILLAARREDFLAVYPFVPSASEQLGEFLRWESIYLLQFFALESFFRGYLLFALNKALGPVAVFVSAVPYCMIHYHKPMLEAFGALAAGVILASLALRWRSWLGGALLHCAVALTMDLLSVTRHGLFD